MKALHKSLKTGTVLKATKLFEGDNPFNKTPQNF